MRKSVVSLVLFGLLGGCAGATSPVATDVILTPVKTRLAPGDVVTARISNRSSDNIQFGACSLRAERRVETTWQLVGPEAIPCILILLEVLPGGERTMAVAPSLAEPGEYRLVFGYSRGDIRRQDDRISYSAPFTVISAQ